MGDRKNGYPRGGGNENVPGVYEYVPVVVSVISRGFPPGGGTESLGDLFGKRRGMTSNGERTGRKTNEIECGVVRTRVVTRDCLVGWLAMEPPSGL
jgi:hypothetical protein